MKIGGIFAGHDYMTQKELTAGKTVCDVYVCASTLLIRTVNI